MAPAPNEKFQTTGLAIRFAEDVLAVDHIDFFIALLNTYLLLLECMEQIG